MVSTVNTVQFIFYISDWQSLEYFVKNSNGNAKGRVRLLRKVLELDIQSTQLQIVGAKGFLYDFTCYAEICLSERSAEDIAGEIVMKVNARCKTMCGNGVNGAHRNDLEVCKLLMGNDVSL